MIESQSILKMKLNNMYTSCIYIIVCHRVEVWCVVGRKVSGGRGYVFSF